MNGLKDQNVLMSILEMAKGFQKEIAEMKETMRSNHQDEVRRIEKNFELERQQMKETHKYECYAYKIDLGQKNTQINNLNNTISGKNTKINSLETSINEKLHMIEELQRKNHEKEININILQGKVSNKAIIIYYY